MAKTVKRKTGASVNYSGELATPIEFSSLVAFFGQDSEAARQFYEALEDAKYKALFKWYSIDPAAPDAWKKLARHLARDHVPGMGARAAPKKPGRPRSWADGLYVKLLRAVEGFCENNKGATVNEAIEALLRDAGWAEYSKDNLLARYGEANRIEKDHGRLYRQWAENPDGGAQALFKPFAIDLHEYFEQLRSEGFKFDEN